MGELCQPAAELVAVPSVLAYLAIEFIVGALFGIRLPRSDHSDGTGSP
jgi:hypothetical protein